MELSLIMYLGIFVIEAILGIYLNQISKENYDTGIGIYKKNGKLVINGKIFFTLMLAILIPAIFAGLRYGIGSDYKLYKNSYYEDINLPYFSFRRFGGVSLEVGYYIITKIAQLIFDNYQGLLFIAAFLTYGFAIISMKRYGKFGNIGMMIPIYFILYYGPSYNIIRQIIATSIIFYGFKYIEEKNIVKYFIVIAIATTFHTSALFCIPIYFLNFSSENFSKIKEFAIIIIALIVPLGFSTIFELLSGASIFSKYTHVYTNQIAYSNNIMTIILRLPVLIMIIINGKKLIRIDTKNRFLILLYILEFSSILMGFYMHWAFRIMYYCMFSEVLLVPQIIRLYKGKTKFVITLYFIVYYFYYFYKVHFIWGNDKIFPYSMFFNK